MESRTERRAAVVLSRRTREELKLEMPGGSVDSAARRLLGELRWHGCSMKTEPELTSKHGLRLWSC